MRLSNFSVEISSAILFLIGFFFVFLFVLDGFDKLNRLSYIGGVGYLARMLLLVFCLLLCLLRIKLLRFDLVCCFGFLFLSWLIGLVFSGVDYNSSFFVVS